MRRAGQRGTDGSATWSLRDLARPVVAVAVVVTVTVSAPMAVMFSCNVHEVGHALTGTAFGWEVERVVPCAPTGGEVLYRTSTTRGDALESWSGGLTGGFVLIVIYFIALRRGSRPMRSPVAWAFGLGLLVPVGPQLVIAFLEGTNRESSYADTISASAGVWVPAILISAAVGPAWHLWRWREVLRRHRGRTNRFGHVKGPICQQDLLGGGQ